MPHFKSDIGSMVKKRKIGLSVASKSLQNGFWRGVCAHAGVFMSPPIVRDKRFDASVERAWSDVGRVLTNATRTEGGRIDKEAGTNRSKGKVPA